MAKIKLSTQNGPYTADVDTAQMDVKITHNSLGVSFVSTDRERLSVCDRDGGFEIFYGGVWYALREGDISTLREPTARTSDG